MAAEVTTPGVGVSAIAVRGRDVLMGRRRGAHGAGTWAFPGGKLEWGERPRDAVVRELREETGLVALDVTPVGWTSDVFDHEGLHFVTLHHRVEVDGEARVLEPSRVDQWLWFAWGELPHPLFPPTAALVAAGWHP